MSLRLGTQEIAPIIEVGGGSAATPKIIMTETTATIQPNIFYVWGEVASLDISLAAETAGIENVYKFQFQSGEVSTSLSLPNDIVFYGEMPNKPNTLYIVSIQSNIAKIERMYTDSLIPNIYQPVVYLQGNGTGAYINTGWYATTLACVEIQLSFPSSSNASACGAEPSGLPKLAVGIYSNNLYLSMGNNSNFIGAPTPNHKYYIVQDVKNRKYGYKENELYPITTTFDDETGPYYLFRLFPNAGTSDNKIYECILKNNDIIERHLYPCYRKEDHVAGMYDVVNHVFYTNDGTGSFVVGPDI